MKTNSALIAMSGGVDSSVSAWLMKQQGFDCIGVTMKLFHNEDVAIPREHSCCSLDDVLDAADVARSIGIRHYVFNFSDRFRDDVLEPFVSSYENGVTPNPCIDCNRYLKFDIERSECFPQGCIGRTPFGIPVRTASLVDLIRTDTAIEAMSKVGFTITKNDYLYTIPKTEVDLIDNPETFPQNPGYN